MALHIPPRVQPTRITIGDAFADLVRRTIKPESAIGRSGDLAAAVHFAAMRVHMRSTLTAAQSQTALPTLDFLDTDPIDIALSIVDGIKAKTVSVEGLPDQFIEQWVARPAIDDWATGLVFLTINGQRTRFYPTLSRGEIDNLFRIGRTNDLQPSAVADPEPLPGSEQVAPTRPVALAALIDFTRGVMATERLTETEARSRATQHFAPKTFPDPLWRAAWKDEPNKRKRGERLPRKSGV